MLSPISYVIIITPTGVIMIQSAELFSDKVISSNSNIRPVQKHISTSMAYTYKQEQEGAE